MLSHLCLAHDDDHGHKVDVLSRPHRFTEALAKLAAEENLLRQKGPDVLALMRLAKKVSS